jgi:DnaJ-class molecular chaperone
MRLFSLFTLLCVTLALLSQLPAPALAARQVESDLYKRLGVRRKASDREIKKAYRNLSRRWHPDRNSHREAFATKKFREVAEAYEVLSDAEKRKEYDLGGGPHHGFPEGQGPGGPGYVQRKGYEKRKKIAKKNVPSLMTWQKKKKKKKKKKKIFKIGAQAHPDYPFNVTFYV